MRIDLCFVPLLLGAAACSTYGPVRTDSGNTITLEQVEKLKPGVTQSSEIAQVIREPNMKVMPPDEKGVEYWLYFDPPSEQSTRFSARIDSKSGILQSMSWSNREGEFGAELNAMKARFASSQFVARERLTVAPNGHAMSTDIIYSDSGRGLEFICENRSNQVDVISWKIPENLSAVAR
jgi:hypothetical protein